MTQRQSGMGDANVLSGNTEITFHLLLPEPDKGITLHMMMFVSE
jgi:hypothetical protein